MSKNVYEECPVYEKELITLRKTEMGDLEELLKCYSDEKAVPLFNSDNCHGDKFNHYGILRIDLKSKYELQPIIENVLAVSNEFFYEAFDVKKIVTKAVPEAKERISALMNMGFNPVNKKVMSYDNYYYREI